MTEKRFTKEEVIGMLEKAIKEESLNYRGSDRVNIRYHGLYIIAKVEKMMQV